MNVKSLVIFCMLPSMELHGQGDVDDGRGYSDSGSFSIIGCNWHEGGPKQSYKQCTLGRSMFFLTTGISWAGVKGQISSFKRLE